MRETLDHHLARIIIPLCCRQDKCAHPFLVGRQRFRFEPLLKSPHEFDPAHPRHVEVDNN